ncbi:magnetosome protein Mad17 [Fundidesulfovibrio magnetotacticus]|uniref:Magnetosome protein Mad17 n=1 Tax=Fundidesulfovibrio magnetotacticus TaxID=2730080 RepID=A0A6V8LHW2_9BACT|nr:FeoB small GTPase domain-containing protein [Fundidesulfovibrio magnetotacticus]GFK92303.1 magnetosome protein Mad17 [Fundidesulfovibrio magnetotacticus]
MSNATQARRAVILGLPNSGKSHLFTRLTGRYAEVANAPLTTIDLNEAPITGEGRYSTLVDTPGIYTLFGDDDSLGCIRKALSSPRPDVILFCIDANRLKQSLGLALEVATLGLPTVYSLNMLDEASRNGLHIDIEALKRTLQAPVATISGKNGNGIAGLLDRARSAVPDGVRHTRSLRQALSTVLEAMPSGVAYPEAEAHALLLSGTGGCRFGCSPGVNPDEPLRQTLGDVRRTMRGDPGVKLRAAWHAWLDGCFKRVARRSPPPANAALSHLGHLCRSVTAGPLILIMILYITFKLVVDGANAIAEAMNNHLWQPVHDALQAVLPTGFWTELLIGDYGMLSMGVANALLTVVPILTVFYFIFNTLEEIGYLPNLSVLTRRLLGKLGLGSSAIMPLVLGFGCKTMATLTAKTIASPRERFITIFLVAFAIPCAGQMGLNMSIVGRMGWGAFIISSVWLLAVELLAGLGLNRFLKQKETLDPFILQLPPIRVPSLAVIAKKTFMKVWTFIKESLGVFILAALFLFSIDAVGILDKLKTWLAPVLEHALGLPASMVDALILLLARHEAAAALIIDLIRKGELNYNQSIVAVTLTTMFAPCFANVMAISKVLSVRDAALIFMAVNICALAASASLNTLLRLFGG